MSERIFRFPHTPYLAWLGNGTPRDDKVLSTSAAKAMLAGDIVAEEKVDGANLGFSLDETRRLRVQTRGQFLVAPYSGQFGRLTQWLALHGEDLAARLEPGWIAFGEWCAARHSISYDRLPDWWLLFDLYDGITRTFVSTERRNEFPSDVGLATVTELFRGRATMSSLDRLLNNTSSKYRNGPLEGIVIRSESPTGLRARAKLVRAEFTQAIEQHWRSRRVEWNRLDSTPAGRSVPGDAKGTFESA
jgi:hypothetical protein